MKRTLIELIGWYGATAIIIAYGLLSLGVVNSSDIFYQILNLSGAVGIVLISFHKKAFQPATLNIIWAVIALFAVLKILLG